MLTPESHRAPILTNALRSLLPGDAPHLNVTVTLWPTILGCCQGHLVASCEDDHGASDDEYDTDNTCLDAWANAEPQVSPATMSTSPNRRRSQK
jgi:hypothetical protein